MRKPHVTAERLRELFDYDPERGYLIRRVKTCAQVEVGDVVDSNGGPNGYMGLSVDGRPYLVHRLVWLHVHGKWPENDIDHMNGVRRDNRIANLRDVTRSVNMQNARKAHADNQAGYLGVYLFQGRWHAAIRVDGKKVWLGSHDTPEDAHAVYLEAKRASHAGCTI